jgi:hypothetical protein
MYTVKPRIKASHGASAITANASAILLLLIDRAGKRFASPIVLRIPPASSPTYQKA